MISVCDNCPIFSGFLKILVHRYQYYYLISFFFHSAYTVIKRNFIHKHVTCVNDVTVSQALILSSTRTECEILTSILSFYKYLPHGRRNWGGQGGPAPPPPPPPLFKDVKKNYMVKKHLNDANGV